MSGKPELLETLAVLAEKLGRPAPQSGTTAELKAMIAEWQAELDEPDADNAPGDEPEKNDTTDDVTRNASSGLVKFRALETLHINARDERGEIMAYVLKGKTGYTDAHTLKELIAAKLAQRLN